MNAIEINKPGFFSKIEIDSKTSDFFSDQGYMVVHDAISQQELTELKAETLAICRQERGEITNAFSIGKKG